MKKRITLCLLILFSFAQGFAQQTSTAQDSMSLTKKKTILNTSWKVIKNSTLSMPQDFVHIGRGFSDNWKKTAIYTGGILGLVLVDRYTTEFYQDEIERLIDYKLPNVSPRKKLPFVLDELLEHNDAYITYSLVGIYGGSLLAKSERGQYAAINSFKALAYSYVISHLALKSIFGRQRPDSTLSDGIAAPFPKTSNPFDFWNFHGITYARSDAYGTSFPSFHATAYFAVAKVLAMEFNNYWIPYLAISGLFLADIRSHKHWVSDMIAGGILGTLIGDAIVKSSRRFSGREVISLKRKASLLDKIDFRLTPRISSNAVGVHLVGTF